MMEFKMPKWVYKDNHISLDECYRELSTLSYQSPVEIINNGIQTKLEEDIYEAILSYGVAVDKDELIKALKYDRNQYEKGFVDGCKNDISIIKAEAIKEFAERLKERGYTNNYCQDIVLVESIDNLVKEMTEGES